MSTNIWLLVCFGCSVAGACVGLLVAAFVASINAHGRELPTAPDVRLDLNNEDN